MNAIPLGWIKVLTSDVAQIVGGGTPPSKDEACFTPPGQGIPWITPADLSGYRDQTISRGTRDLSTKGLASCSAKVMPSGTVLFSSRAPIGYVAIASNPVATNQGFKSFVLPKEIDSRFAYYQLKHIKPVAEALATGTTFKELSGSAAAKLPFLVAPHLEQKRIADKLDTVLTRVDAVNTRLARVAPLLKRFRQSVLAAATSGRLTEDWRQEILGTHRHDYQSTEISVPYPQRITAPDAWKLHIFDEVVELVGGSQPPKATFVNDEQPGYVRLIQIRDYKSDRHLTYIPRALARRFCSTTDVMIGRYGPPIFQILRGLEGAYNVALMKAVPRNGLLTNDFLYYWLQRDDLLRFVEAGSDRTAGQDGVRKEHLIKYPVFVPTVLEQTEIVRRVETLFAFADRLEARLQTAQTAADRLTPALLAKAFRGELVPQDPNDEPASELLKRLTISDSKPVKRRGRSKVSL